MANNRENIIQCIIQSTGVKQLNPKVKTALETLQILATSEGLEDNDLNAVCDFLIETKLSAQYRCISLTCLIPQGTIPDKCLKKLILWYFAEAGNNTITYSVEKLFLQWLTGIVYYELGDMKIVDSYYYTFLFLLNRNHVLGAVCKLLCLISKPEDAKRWVIQHILQIHVKTGCRSHTSSVLSLLKSFRPEVVPERIPVTNFTYESFGKFNDGLKSAHERKISNLEEEITKVEDLKWDSWQIYNNKKSLPRLIPPPENLNLDTNLVRNDGRISVIDIKTVLAVGANILRIKYPAQTMSLLANQAGFHLLTFGDESLKSRFSHVLHHILYKVFWIDMLPYSEIEKINLLRAIKSFQEYSHQSVPVVTNFLFNYLLVWDGESYLFEILGLLEWIDLPNEKDLEKHVFAPLRQVFISAETHIKCLIIKTLGNLLKNLVILDKRENGCFQNNYKGGNLFEAVSAIANFASELVRHGLIWNKERGSRNFLTSSLDFYDVASAVERIGDLPMVILMPPALVYTCLFLGSRVCIARICSLLNRLQVFTVERLHLLGVYHDFNLEVAQLHTYMLDYYRCLWTSTAYQKNCESFFIHDDLFRRMLNHFKEQYGEDIHRIFGVECNAALLYPEAMGNRENMLKELGRDFPDIVELKNLVEVHVLA